MFFIDISRGAARHTLDAREALQIQPWVLQNFGWHRVQSGGAFCEDQVLLALQQFTGVGASAVMQNDPCDSRAQFCT